MCGNDFTRGIAYLSSGALLLTPDGRDSLHPGRLQAFLHVGVHGRDPDMHDSADIAVVADLHLGDGPSGLEVLRDAKAKAPNSLRVLMSNEEGLASLGKPPSTELVQRYVQKPGCGIKLAHAIRDSLRDLEALED